MTVSLKDQMPMNIDSFYSNGSWGNNLHQPDFPSVEGPRPQNLQPVIGRPVDQITGRGETRRMQFFNDNLMALIQSIVAHTNDDNTIRISMETMINE